MARVVKGFTIDTGNRVHDHHLMAMDANIVASMMNNMKYLQYLKWKINRMEKALRDRNDNNDYSAESQARINYTIKAIDYSQGVLDEYEKNL